MLLALSSAARESETGFLDIRYFTMNTFGYTFHFGKNTKRSKRSKTIDPIKFHVFKKNQSWCFYQCIDLYLERTMEIRRKNSQLRLSFVQPHGPVTPTILRRFMMVLNLSDIGNKTFTGQSARIAASAKSNEAGIPTGKILKRGFWSKELIFEKIYLKGIHTEDLHFQLSILKRFGERFYKQ